MTTHRFEVIPVLEPARRDSSSQPFEIIPLIKIENEIPRPPPLPQSLSSTNEKTNNRISSRLFHAHLRRKSLDTRRRRHAAAVSHLPSSQHVLDKIDATSLGHIEDSDVYSTNQSNNYDTNPLSITNKFLHELRLKRREFHVKAKNISIDQRIDLNRQRNKRQILRAQDIFDVHFELTNDDDDKICLTEYKSFTEESQEKIRHDIYNELNRQRKKQYRKHHQHLLLGRALLMIMTSLLAFMSFTLIYVVLDLYNRANSLDVILPENEFISMIYDKRTNLY